MTTVSEAQNQRLSNCESGPERKKTVTPRAIAIEDIQLLFPPTPALLCTKIAEGSISPLLLSELEGWPNIQNIIGEAPAVTPPLLKLDGEAKRFG